MSATGGDRGVVTPSVGRAARTVLRLYLRVWVVVRSNVTTEHGLPADLYVNGTMTLTESRQTVGVVRASFSRYGKDSNLVVQASSLHITLKPAAAPGGGLGAAATALRVCRVRVTALSCPDGYFAVLPNGNASLATLTCTETPAGFYTRSPGVMLPCIAGRFGSVPRLHDNSDGTAEWGCSGACPLAPPPSCFSAPLRMLTPTPSNSSALHSNSYSPHPAFQRTRARAPSRTVTHKHPPTRPPTRPPAQCPLHSLLPPHRRPMPRWVLLPGRHQRSPGVRVQRRVLPPWLHGARARAGRLCGVPLRRPQPAVVPVPHVGCRGVHRSGACTVPHGGRVPGRGGHALPHAAVLAWGRPAVRAL
jgi:hypothetical protein